MTDTVTHWKLREVAVTKPPTYNYEQVAQEHRGFLVTRADSEYLLWAITTKEGTKPPIPLRSNFTTKQKAMSCIDAWLEDEKNKTA